MPSLEIYPNDTIPGFLDSFAVTWSFTCGHEVALIPVVELARDGGAVEHEHCRGWKGDDTLRVRCGK